MTPPKTKKYESQESDTSDERTTNSPPKRSDCLYFNDGNVALIAQDTAFRVHKSVLALHSEVFRNMFGDVNQPEDAEMFDSCSVVRVSDESEALETFLKVLYMIEPIRDAENPGVYFPHVLRLATKYLCNAIRRQALDEFCWRYFPDSLADWDDRDGSLAPENVIGLARDIKGEILLPAAFYHLCQDGPDTGDLYQNDVVTLWIGSRIIGSFWPIFLKKQMDHRDEPPCDHPQCRIAWRTFWEKKSLEALEIGQTVGMDPLLQLEKCPDDLDGMKNVCWEAKKIFRKLCDAKRVKIWNELPKVFGLGSCAKLRATTDGLCGEHIESPDSSGTEQ